MHLELFFESKCRDNLYAYIYTKIIISVKEKGTDYKINQKIPCAYSVCLCLHNKDYESTLIIYSSVVNIYWYSVCATLIGINYPDLSTVPVWAKSMTQYVYFIWVYYLLSSFLVRITCKYITKYFHYI